MKQDIPDRRLRAAQVQGFAVGGEEEARQVLRRAHPAHIDVTVLLLDAELEDRLTPDIIA